MLVAVLRKIDSNIIYTDYNYICSGTVTMKCFPSKWFANILLYHIFYCSSYIGVHASSIISLMQCLKTCICTYIHYCCCTGTNTLAKQY